MSRFPFRVVALGYIATAWCFGCGGGPAEPKTRSPVALPDTEEHRRAAAQQAEQAAKDAAAEKKRLKDGRVLDRMP